MPGAKQKVSSFCPEAYEGYSYLDLKKLLSITLEENISALVLGHPGVGKSTLAQELAAEAGLPLHDIRLAQREPADLWCVFSKP
jgi:MoxR-like ATPase